MGSCWVSSHFEHLVNSVRITCTILNPSSPMHVRSLLTACSQVATRVAEEQGLQGLYVQKRVLALLYQYEHTVDSAPQYPQSPLARYVDFTSQRTRRVQEPNIEEAAAGSGTRENHACSYFLNANYFTPTSVQLQLHSLSGSGCVQQMVLWQWPPKWC